MKRAFYYFGALVVMLLGIATVNDIACQYLTSERFGMSAGKLKRFYQEDDPDEIPLIGSSIVKCGMLPSELFPRCYNYGEDGMLNFELLSLLKYAVEKKTNKVILFNIDPWWYSDNESFSRYRGDYALAPESGVLSRLYSFLGVRFFGRFRPSLVSWLQRTSNQSKFIVDHGAVSQNSFKSSEQWKAIYDVALKRDNKFMPNERADAELRHCINMLGDKRLVITALPCIPEYRRNYLSAEVFSSYLEGLRRKRNVTVIDLFTTTNAVPGLDESCFFDHQHLNAKGAAKTSKVLKRRLLEMGVICE